MNLCKKILLFHILLMVLCYIWIGYMVYRAHIREDDYDKEEFNYLTDYFPDNCNINDTIQSISVSNTSILSTVNLSKISYVTNPLKLCTKSSLLKLVVVIVSDPRNKERRNILRITWTKPLSLGLNSSFLFLIGLNEDDKVNSEVYNEYEEFKDMVIVDFDDTYRNLSLKIVLMLRWVHDFCPNAQFVLKCDDDMFINVYNLMDFILYEDPNQRSFYGKVLHATTPVRSTKSPYAKWLATLEEYPDSYYPDYVSGPAYVFSTDGISDLLNACLRLPYFYLEDVFVTGLCAKAVNYCRKQNSQFVNSHISNRKCSVTSVISVHEIFGRKMRILWNRIRNFDTYKACKRTEPKNYIF